MEVTSASGAGSEIPQRGRRRSIGWRSSAGVVEVPADWLLTGKGEPPDLPDIPIAQEIEALSDQGEGEEEVEKEPPEERKGRPWPSERDIWGSSINTIRQHLESTDDPAEILFIHESEQKNPDYEGGRKGALAACAERLDSLGYEIVNEEEEDVGELDDGEEEGDQEGIEGGDEVEEEDQEEGEVEEEVIDLGEGIVNEEEEEEAPPPPAPTKKVRSRK